jgi:hypothetical protein
VDQSVSSMSDMATRPKAMNAMVVRSARPPSSALRLSKSWSPTHAAASTAPIAARAGTRRAAPGSKPHSSKEPAMSQYVRAGLSKNGWPR